MKAHCGLALVLLLLAAGDAAGQSNTPGAGMQCHLAECGCGPSWVGTGREWCGLAGAPYRAAGGDCQRGMNGCANCGGVWCPVPALPPGQGTCALQECGCPGPFRQQWCNGRNYMASITAQVDEHHCLNSQGVWCPGGNRPDTTTTTESTTTQTATAAPTTTRITPNTPNKTTTATPTTTTTAAPATTTTAAPPTTTTAAPPTTTTTKATTVAPATTTTAAPTTTTTAAPTTTTTTTTTKATTAAVTTTTTAGTTRPDKRTTVGPGVTEDGEGVVQKPDGPTPDELADPEHFGGEASMQEAIGGDAGDAGDATSSATGAVVGALVGLIVLVLVAALIVRRRRESQRATLEKAGPFDGSGSSSASLQPPLLALAEFPPVTARRRSSMGYRRIEEAYEAPHGAGAEPQFLYEDVGEGSAAPNLYGAAANPTAMEAEYEYASAFCTSANPSSLAAVVAAAAAGHAAYEAAAPPAWEDTCEPIYANAAQSPAARGSTVAPEYDTAAAGGAAALYRPAAAPAAAPAYTRATASEAALYESAETVRSTGAKAPATAAVYAAADADAAPGFYDAAAPAYDAAAADVEAIYDAAAPAEAVSTSAPVYDTAAPAEAVYDAPSAARGRSVRIPAIDSASA